MFDQKGKYSLHGMKNRFRIHWLRALQDCIKDALVDLNSQVVQGFHCKKIDGTQLLAHFVIVIYAASITETKDLLGAKQGS